MKVKKGRKEEAKDEGEARSAEDPTGEEEEDSETIGEITRTQLSFFHVGEAEAYTNQE